MNLTRGTILENTYEIIEEIGAGGGGVVFRARHLRLQTDVVVKRIKDEVREKVKLRQEADILKNLKHPCLPRVYDFIETEDGVYTVMDFIDGEDLENAVKKHGKFPQKQVKKWAEQLGSALEHLHSQNPPIIHSDIKPANVMLTKEGDVCLIDFNISLAMGGTMESAVGISVGFSPPEQYRDPALFARITHNYTMQKSMNMTGTAAKSKAQDETGRDKAEVWREAYGPDGDQTAVLETTGKKDNGQTALLKTAEKPDNEQTALLKTTGKPDNDQVALLETAGEPDNGQTALPETAGEPDNRLTAVLRNADGTDNDHTVLLKNTDIPADDQTVVLENASDTSDQTVVLKDTTETGNGRTASPTGNGSLPKYTQFIGKGIDARSDIYSLGITLYYMLTGIEPPPDFEQRIPITETKAVVSEGFAIILEKMMELSPAERYQNGGEFLKAVKNCHKLDHRYIVMHRKQTAMQTLSLLSLAAGILLVFGGIYGMRKEKNSAYYELVSRAVEEMEHSDYDAAGGMLEEAKELSENRIDAYGEEIYLLYLSGNYTECISLGEEYINTMPFLVATKEDEEQFANIYYLVGNAYFETQDYASAEKLFSHALERYTQNALYYRDYAITLAKMGQNEEAKKILETGTELGLAQDSIYMAQGEIARAEGQYEDAAAYLKQTIETTADMQMKRRAVLLCVDVYKTVGSEAVEDEAALLEQYKDQFDGNGKLVMTEKLAESYARMAQADETKAEECYEKALELFLSIYEDGYVTYQLQENIAILYENMQQFDEAEKVLLSMGESYPERYEVYKRLAFLEADRQQVKDNIDRDYKKMQEYYETAKEKYAGKERDMEMEMLDAMMQDIKDGGWL